jgi:hypothetical protein
VLNRIDVQNDPVNFVDPMGLQGQDPISGKVIVKQNGVTIEHYGTADHGPAHAHVKGGGAETKIGPKGYPIKNQPSLTAKQRGVVQRNSKIIRTELNKLGRANMRLSGLKIGVIGDVSLLLNFYEAQKLADERGVDVWTILLEQMGVQFVPCPSI